MMTLAQMQEAITKLTQDFVSLRNENEALRRENEALRMDNDSIRALSTTTHNQYLALAESTKLLVAERDELKKRISELEAVNKKLTDMLWGRRSERRIGNNETPFLDFGDDLPSLQEMKSEALPPDVIIAQAAAQNALDLAKLAELKARREARQARQQAEQSRETFPEHMERRDVVLDLPEDQKEGLKLITTKVTERLRFEKPTVYVERISRRVYARTEVRAGSNESAIVAPPSPPAIVEGCKYDFSVIAQDLELDSPLLMNLLPDRWAATHPQHVQHERLAEKRQVAEDKQYYRLQVGLAGIHPYASTSSLPSPE